MKTCHENGVFGPRDVIIMLYSTLLAYGGRCEMRNDPRAVCLAPFAFSLTYLGSTSGPSIE